VSAALRKWSQHWLVNDDLARALVRLIGPQPEERFLEIGAGQGLLTRALLDHEISLTAIEVDPQCVALLTGLGDGKDLTVVHSDVLQIDPSSLGIEAPIRLVGNLPYAISSPILRWTVKYGASFSDVHFMLPEDVAERAFAAPGSAARGLLSVLVQWAFEGAILRRLGPGAFRPPPKIDSAFARMRRRTPPPCEASPEHVEFVLQAAFQHRRKTLSNSLQAAGWRKGTIDEACSAAEVAPGLRAQALTVEQFARLAERLPQEPS
jgi:16S rRNA (adenine1518-N6/adenine1519-N6)-dimethyltransferase